MFRCTAIATSASSGALSAERSHDDDAILQSERFCSCLAAVTLSLSAWVKAERSHESQPFLHANRFCSCSGDCADISSAKQSRDIISEKQATREIAVINFHPLSAKDSSRTHFEDNYRPDELGKTEQHCSVSNLAQTNTTLGR